MVDSRAKGGRGEYIVRDLLRKHTGLPFERVPMSGALSYLKGDLYVPHEKNIFCIEVKNYADSPLNDKIFTNKTNNLVKWWTKIVDQAEAEVKKPLLFFKYNRSKVFVATYLEPEHSEHMYLSKLNCFVCLAEEWLGTEEIEFIE